MEKVTDASACFGIRGQLDSYVHFKLGKIDELSVEEFKEAKEHSEEIEAHIESCGLCWNYFMDLLDRGGENTGSDLVDKIVKFPKR